MLYLDNSSTTKTSAEVIKIMSQVSEKYFANPSSLHGQGLKAEKVLNRSREIIAHCLGVLPTEIVFTSGGTEGDNLALKGIAFAYGNRGKHIVTTKIEHPAIFNSCAQLEQFGFEITYLDVDRQGLVNPRDLEQAMRDDTILVSVMQVNNEVGSIQPLAQIGKIVQGHPLAFFHTDAVQGFAKVPLELKSWSVDLATISGHKIHGPKGIGCLYVRDGLRLWPLLSGGGQENTLRSGTENLPAIAGLAQACQMVSGGFGTDALRMKGYRDQCVARLKKEYPQIVLNGPASDYVSPYILNISIPGLQGEILLHALEKEGVYVSTGSACSSKKDIYSPVLKAMGLEQRVAQGSIRVSFSYGTTQEDLQIFFDALNKALAQLSLLEGRVQGNV